jgi:hypothetical protein
MWCAFTLAILGRASQGIAEGGEGITATVPGASIQLASCRTAALKQPPPSVPGAPAARLPGGDGGSRNSRSRRRSSSSRSHTQQHYQQRQWMYCWQPPSTRCGGGDLRGLQRCSQLQDHPGATHFLHLQQQQQQQRNCPRILFMAYAMLSASRAVSSLVAVHHHQGRYFDCVSCMP